MQAPSGARIADAAEYDVLVRNERDPTDPVKDVHAYRLMDILRARFAGRPETTETIDDGKEVDNKST